MMFGARGRDRYSVREYTLYAKVPKFNAQHLIKMQHRMPAWEDYFPRPWERHCEK